VNPFRWFRRSNRLDELSDEIQSHLEEKTDELVARGMSRGDAEREARRAFGNVTRVKDAAGDVWRFESFLGNAATDVRHAVRGLIQRPGYAVAVVLTLALGIGANAVVFAMVNAIVLRPLPYPESDRIVSISQRGSEGRDGRTLNNLVYEDWLQTTRTVESQAAYSDGLGVVLTPQGPTRLDGLWVTPAYFGIFRVKPLLGRTFDENEAVRGGPPVIVLSEPLWRERFAADPAILGRSLTFDGKPRLVIGVLPAAFTVGRTERFWIPLFLTPSVRQSNAESGEWIGYSVVARLRADASIDRVQTELETVFGRLKQQGFGPNVGTPVVMSLHERRHGETRRPLLLLFAAVGVLLLTACANIANLALARAARREREFAVRLALGASRWRIVRLVLIENLALAAGGALVGLLLVRVSLGWFVYISPGSIQSTERIGVSGALVLYASAVAILTALLFGLVPALTASRAAPNHTLASGTPHAAGSRRHSFARRALVVGELAIALVFLTGAGLVAKTFWRVTRVDPGFKAEKVLLAKFQLGDRYTNATAQPFWDAVMTRVRREPGVQSAAYAWGAPMTRSGISKSITMSLDGKRTRQGARHAAVDPEYFETVGAELLAGRFFGPEDRKGTPRVAIVSEGYSARNLDGAPALGATVRGEECLPNAKCRLYTATIVGVVKEMVQEATDGEQYPLVFEPLAQKHREVPVATLLVRTSVEPAQVQAWIRDEVKALDPQQPEPSFSSMERTLAERVAPRKFTLVLLVAFAALAGGLAIIGLYSVLAYLVAERTREIGIRIAVGADRARVTRMVLWQGLRFTLVGIALGAMVSISAVRVLRAWMYEMSVYDAPTFIAVAALLGVVALIASWLPARRASRVDPVLALRAD
jgi:putative ABC transport system permease protein